MKKLLLLGLSLVLAGSASAVTLDFEGLPLDYYYFYGMQNLGGYYDGVTFGPTVYILDANIGGYNSGGYPPHSGSAVAVSIGTDYIRADFDVATNHVDVWYTSGSGDLWLEAYDSGGNQLDSAQGPSNYGTNGNLAVDASGIAYVLIHDAGDFFTIDDFTFTEGPNPVEETTWGAVKNLYR